MELNEYQRLAMRTANNDLSERDALTVAALGLAGEAGEVADSVKKVLGQSHELDRHKLADEVGDVLWYVALMCEALDLWLDEVAERNIAKLRRRYPDGFEAERSRNREG